MINASQTLLTINDEGDFGRMEIRHTPLGGVEAMLLPLMGNVSIRVPNVFIVEGQSVNMSVGNLRVNLSTRLTELRLKTTFAPVVINGQTRIAPVFAQEPGGQELELTWRIPLSMELWFVQSISRTTAQSYFSSANLYLAARDVEKKTRVLPMGNLYDDGRLCTAIDYCYSGGVMMHEFQRALHTVDDSKWNGDLMNATKKERAALIFGFDPNSLEPLEEPEGFDWTAHCPLAGSEVLSCLH